MSGDGDGGSVVTANELGGQRAGLLFYGADGRKATSWKAGSSSYLCVHAPTQRTPLQASGGTSGACDRQLSLDFASCFAGSPTVLGQPLSVGDTLNVRTWFRDPLAPVWQAR